MTPLHRLAQGSGNPPLVFVHGFACDHTDWAAQIAHFAPRHACLAIDLPGHGQTPGVAEDCTIERFAADLVTTLRRREQAPAVLFGHSMGCRVVVEAALQAPEQVRALVLVDGSQFAPAMGATLRAQFAQPNGFEMVANQWFTEMFTPKSAPATVTAALARAQRMHPVTGAALLLDLQRYDSTRLQANLAALRVKILALQTTWSNEKRERASLRPGQTTPYLDMLSATVADLQTAIIPDTGHFPQLDEPAATNSAISEFLARCHG